MCSASYRCRGPLHKKQTEKAATCHMQTQNAYRFETKWIQTFFWLGLTSASSIITIVSKTKTLFETFVCCSVIAYRVADFTCVAAGFLAQASKLFVCARKGYGHCRYGCQNPQTIWSAGERLKTFLWNFAYGTMFSVSLCDTSAVTCFYAASLK